MSRPSAIARKLDHDLFKRAQEPDRAGVLVIAAHPDDETLGCGGTIARTVREGTPVDVVIVTKVGPYLERYRDFSDVALDELRQRDAHAACEVLGVRDLFFGDFEETHLAARPFPALVEFLKTIIARTNPLVIYTHSERDQHQDHEAIARATVIAARPYVLYPTSRTRCLFAYASPIGLPAGSQCFVALRADHVDLKVLALTQYATELRAAPHPRSCETVRANALAIGSLAGMLAAEVFESLWEVR